MGASPAEEESCSPLVPLGAMGAGRAQAAAGSACGKEGRTTGEQEFKGVLGFPQELGLVQFLLGLWGMFALMLLCPRQNEMQPLCPPTAMFTALPAISRGWIGSCRWFLLQGQHQSWVCCRPGSLRHTSRGDMGTGTSWLQWLWATTAPLWDVL